MRNRGLGEWAVTVRLTNQHREKLERLAAATGRNPSAVLRRLLELAEAQGDGLTIQAQKGGAA